jgi:hypothetical protein
LKRILAVVAVLAALSLSAGSAGAATPQAKQLKTLQAQVKTLQKQVKTLQSQVKLVSAVAGANWSATTCSMAMTADLFQATWSAIGGTTFNTLLTPVSDYGACSNIELTRTSGATLSPYNNLIAWLYGPA